MAFLSQEKLPVIDLSVKKLNSSVSTWETTAGEVTHALEKYGCFIALYDQVSPELHDAAFAASKQVLDLPPELKKLNKVEAAGHSYVGLGSRPKLPRFERLSIEDAHTEQGVERFTKLMWPSGNPSFCESTLMFSKAIAKLQQQIVMRMVAQTYGIEQEYETLLGATTHILKFNNYKAPKGENESNMGLYAHTDKTFMTIIHQQEEQGKGLEIQTKNGEWMQVDLSPTSFVVMAGDVCMAWTNGRIEAPNHRVMVNGKRDRVSLVLASFIRGLKVEAPQALIDEDHPLKFKPFEHYKYIAYHSNNSDIVDGKRVNVSIQSYCGV